MKKYDFDKVIDRHDTACVKYDDLMANFGRTDLIPLWIADMDFEVCHEIIEACEKRLHHPVFGYPAAPQSYWQSIINWQKKHNNFNIEREEIDFIPGIVKGIAFAVSCFTAPGDKVVIQPPVYHPFRRVVEQNDRVAVTNPLKEISPGKYAMDLEGLKEVIRKEQPKMLILCNPHNPIGIAWAPEVLRELAEICAAGGVLVVSDEIHGDIVWENNRHTPFATVSDTAANISVSFGAPSKTFNIPGFVSSWCVVKNKALREKFFTWLESKELDGINITSALAAEAAYTNGEEWLRQAKEYLEGNIQFVMEYVNNNIPGLRVEHPQATFLMWLDCRGLGLTHEQLLDLLINKARVAMNDGTMFGAEGEGFMRMNIASPRSVLREALERIKSAINP